MHVATSGRSTVEPVLERESANIRAIYRLSAVLLIGLASCNGGDSSGPGTENPGTGDHGIGATVLLYAQTANDAIIEAEILLDGNRKGAPQRVVNGTFQYWLTFEQRLGSSGRHRVGVRIIDQKYQAVEYIIGGAAYGVNLKSQASNQVSFPSHIVTLREGDVVEVTVDVP